MTKEKALAKFTILLNHFEELVESKVAVDIGTFWDFEDYSEVDCEIKEAKENLIAHFKQVIENK